MGKENLVIVESPAKAKTISKYLGSNFEVLASFGHVRDLLAKDGSVDPDDDFALIWDVDDRGAKHLKSIIAACKEAKHLYLATDPDREGEAISWHVYEELQRRKALKNVESVDRIVFHEITKHAIEESLRTPRELDQQLIDAYLARRVLDYLVGFNLSPVLWRKLPGAKSAGRVQSVSLRLVCEREHEIEVFKSQEYWSVVVGCYNGGGDRFSGKLSRLDGEELQKFSLTSEDEAKQACDIVEGSQFALTSLTKKQKMRYPSPPFTTSTMQQDSNRKLGFGTTRTMQIAQKLYEGVDIGGTTQGLISYMRTDSTHLSEQALGEARKMIKDDFGDSYLPEKAIRYKTKTKNAQEAHEAIRPTNFSLTPSSARKYLTEEQSRLYELIWKRCVASQMRPAILDITSVLIESGDKKTALKASGSIVRFDGFLTLYTDIQNDDKDDKDDSGKDDNDKEKDSDNKILPPLEEGEVIRADDAKGNQHFTQPPPRYSEAALVKKMEEIGIGRPSTYASILKVLQDREYVRLDGKRFLPEQRGRLVNAFLCGFFTKYVDYEFTAAMEDSFDEISRGQAYWKKILEDFWRSFYATTENALKLEFTDVRAVVDAALGELFFARDESGSDELARKCPMCDGGRLGVNYGKYGLYVNCTNYPECRYTKQGSGGGDDSDDGKEYPIHLGEHEAQPVTLRKGPYGIYVQQGEGSKDEVKRSSLPRLLSPDDVDLRIALKLLALPRLLGSHPDSGDDIHAGLGRYGPYLKHGSKYVSLVDDDVLEIGLNRAVEVIATQASKGGVRRFSEPIRDLGEHPDGGVVGLFKGRYGHYVKWGKINASLPKSSDPDSVTLVDSLDWLAERQNRPVRGGFKKKGRAKKAGVKKAGAKKVVAKKARARSSGGS